MNFVRMRYMELTLVILGAVFIYQIEATPSNALNYLEEIVNGTVEFVSDYEYQLAVDGDKQFGELLNGEKETIVRNVTDVQRVIQEAIQGAHIKDSLARKCNRSAVLGLFRAQRKLISLLGGCFANNNSNLSNFHEEIEVNIETGKQLLNKFTGIREYCMSELVNEELCIARQLPEVTGLAALYEANVAKLKADVAVTTAKGYENIAFCSESPLAIFRIEIQEIVIMARECIKSV